MKYFGLLVGFFALPFAASSNVERNVPVSITFEGAAQANIPSSTVTIEKIQDFNEGNVVDIDLKYYKDTRYVRISRGPSILANINPSFNIETDTRREYKPKAGSYPIFDHPNDGNIGGIGTIEVTDNKPMIFAMVLPYALGRSSWGVKLAVDGGASSNSRSFSIDGFKFKLEFLCMRLDKEVSGPHTEEPCSVGNTLDINLPGMLPEAAENYDGKMDFLGQRADLREKWKEAARTFFIEYFIVLDGVGMREPIAKAHERWDNVQGKITAPLFARGERDVKLKLEFTLK